MSGVTHAKVLTWAACYTEARALCQALDCPLLFTNGVFDLLHPGHVDFLERVGERERGVLVVGVNTDASVRALKGPSRPIQGEQDRMRMVAALAAVRFVVPFEQATACELVQFLQPAVYVKADSYAKERLPEASVVASYGGRVELLPMTEGYSTTGLIRRIATNYGLEVPLAGRLKGPLVVNER